VSLVTAEDDVTVIRSWLGHESLDTTNIYAQANVEAHGCPVKYSV